MTMIFRHIVLRESGRFGGESMQDNDTGGRLAAEHPDCHVQTHIDENRAEIAFACELYPEAADYADIYRGYGLLGPKSLMGHCIHMT